MLMLEKSKTQECRINIFNQQFIAKETFVQSQFATVCCPLRVLHTLIKNPNICEVRKPCQNKMHF